MISEILTTERHLTKEMTIKGRMNASKRCYEISDESMDLFDRIIKIIEEQEAIQYEMGPEKRCKVEEIFNKMSHEIEEIESERRDDFLSISVKSEAEEQSI